MSDAFIAPNFDNIPVELRSRPWVTWKAEGNPGEKPRKVPYVPGRPHARASSTDPTTWGSLDQAIAAFSAGDFAGVGTVLDGTGMVGVDIDHCVVNGVPDTAALALLEKLGAGYIEISPSGTGLRAFGYAENLQSGAKGKYNGLDVELYSSGRYLTVTGMLIKSGPITPLNSFSALAERLRTDRKVSPLTGVIIESAPDERHANLMQRILSGDVYHDSLRDMAASLIGSGLHPGATVNHLRSLMDVSQGPHDDRWTARRAQIPDLVSSASKKYSPIDTGGILPRVSHDSASQPAFKLLTADDLRGLPRLRWCVRGVLPVEGLVALYGPSGSGKSFLGLDLAIAIAEARPWFDCRVRPVPVLYVCLEGESGLSLRVQAWELSQSRKLPEGLRMMVQPFKLTEPGNVRELAALIPKGAVVFIDTLNRAAPTADENSSRDMGEIIEAAKLLQSLTSGLVVLVHHTGKDTTRGLRGHSSLFAAMDACIEVSRQEDLREWKVSKSKDGADGISHQFFLEVVNLGQDEFGDTISSCVVLVDEAPLVREKPMTDRQIEGMASYQRAAELFGELTNTGQFDGLGVELWRNEFYRTCTAEKTNGKKIAFLRVRNDLVKMGLLIVSNDVYRLAGQTAVIRSGIIAGAIRKRSENGTRYTVGT